MTFFTWADIWKHRDDIEADMQQVYGIDLTGGVLATRTARWLRVRVEGLLSLPESRLARALKG